MPDVLVVKKSILAVSCRLTVVIIPMIMQGSLVNFQKFRGEATKEVVELLSVFVTTGAFLLFCFVFFKDQSEKLKVSLKVPKTYLT